LRSSPQSRTRRLKPGIAYHVECRQRRSARQPGRWHLTTFPQNILPVRRSARPRGTSMPRTARSDRRARIEVVPRLPRAHGTRTGSARLMRIETTIPSPTPAAALHATSETSPAVPTRPILPNRPACHRKCPTRISRRPSRNRRRRFPSHPMIQLHRSLLRRGDLRAGCRHERKRGHAGCRPAVGTS
jgi:hypothetical protein